MLGFNKNYICNNLSNRCCDALKACSYKNSHIGMGSLSNCIPGYSGGGFFRDGDYLAFSARTWVCLSQIDDECEDFYHWCGMKCEGQRLVTDDSKDAWDPFDMNSPTRHNKIKRRRISICGPITVEIDETASDNFWKNIWEQLKKSSAIAARKLKDILKIGDLCDYPESKYQRLINN
uniref:Uncharacterized protein n=1 Tax=Meloidogyne incognita TaxID=6306 RepID=A0A914KQQ4_MELIC